MALKNFQKVINNTPDDIKFYVQDSMSILERLHELLDEKFEGKQKLLAEKMGKSEAEVSKMLSGVQNFTLRTLSKLRAAFGEPVIAICTNHHEHASFMQVKVPPLTGQTQLFVKENGQLSQETKVSTAFKPIKSITVDK